MAEADIDAIIATSDGDTTWGADLRGAMTTLKSNAGRGAVRNQRWFTPNPNSYVPLLGGIRSSSLGDVFTGGTAYYFPFQVSSTLSITHLSVDAITLSAGVTRKYAIFSPTSTNGVGTLVTNTSISYDMSSTGYKTATLAATVVLTPGIYWLGSSNSGGACEVRCFNSNEALMFMVSPGAAIDADMCTFATNGASHASFPETTPASMVYTGQGSENPPWVIATLA